MKNAKNVQRKLTWVPDLPDKRDLLFKPKKLRLPNKVDLRAKMTEIEDQGNLGSCTGNALAGNVEFLRKDFEASRLFIYYNERMIEGTTSSDEGAYIRDGIKSLAKYGVASEELWPYDIDQFTVKPPKAAYKDALNHQITKYLRIDGKTTEEVIANALNCLAQGFPFVFGTTWYSSFSSSSVARTGKLPVIKKTDTVEGGHAMCAVGYDKTKKVLIVRNSWGSGWGDKGYCYFPFANFEVFDDLWTIRAQE